MALLRARSSVSIGPKRCDAGFDGQVGKPASIWNAVAKRSGDWSASVFARPAEFRMRWMQARALALQSVNASQF